MVATASFGITGPTESDTCELANGGTTLNCTFNGSTSTAPGTIVQYDWSYRVATGIAQTQTTTVPELKNPSITIDCSVLPTPPLQPGKSITLTVTLKIRDSLNNTAEATNSNARLLPMGACGF